jgi:hypothetical protein
MHLEIEIPDQEDPDLLRFTGAKTVEAAVLVAVAEFNQWQSTASTPPIELYTTERIGDFEHESAVDSETLAAARRETCRRDE